MQQLTWLKIVHSDVYIWCYALLLVHARNETMTVKDALKGKI